MFSPVGQYGTSSHSKSDTDEKQPHLYLLFVCCGDKCVKEEDREVRAGFAGHAVREQSSEESRGEECLRWPTYPYKAGSSDLILRTEKQNKTSYFLKRD